MIANHTRNANPTHTHTRIVGATLDRPCPVCGKKKDCRAGDSGLHFCRSGLRGERDGYGGFEYIGDSRCGTWGMYRVAGSVPAASPAPAPARDPADIERERLAREAAAAAKAAAEAKEAEFAARRRDTVVNNITPAESSSLDYLARTLKLPRFCLDALQIDMFEHPSMEKRWAWVFYETIPGSPQATPTLRYLDGRKLAYGPRGIIVPTNWNQIGEPLYIVEGASDVLALYALGLSAIGRPNNTGGAEHIAAFVLENNIQPGRPIIVLGENDQKRDGSWPGMDGARRVSAKLAELLPGHPVTMAFPPEAAKDVRQWLINHVGASLGREALADLGGKFAKIVSTNPRKPFDIHPAEEENPSTATAAAPGRAAPTIDIANLAELADFVAADRAAHRVDHVERAAKYNDPHPESHTLEFCPNCRSIGEEHLRRPIFGIFQAPCRKLDCPWCHSVKKLQYNATNREHLTTHERAGGDLYLFKCSAEQWRRIYDKLNRSGGLYMRFEPSGNRQFVVVSTVPPRDVEYTKIDAEAAIDYLARIINTIPLIDYKPFSSSRKWKLVGNGPPGKEKLWRRLGKITTDIETAQTVMELKTGEPVKIHMHARRFWSVRSMQCSTLRHSAEAIYAAINHGDDLPDCDVTWGSGNERDMSDTEAAAVCDAWAEERKFVLDLSS